MAALSSLTLGAFFVVIASVLLGAVFLDLLCIVLMVVSPIAGLIIGSRIFRRLAATGPKP